MEFTRDDIGKRFIIHDVLCRLITIRTDRYVFRSVYNPHWLITLYRDE